MKLDYIAFVPPVYFWCSINVVASGNSLARKKPSAKHLVATAFILSALLSKKRRW